MYPSPFHYHRAQSLEEASRLLREVGADARPLAGGQSLVPLMKLRLAAPAHLVDLNFIPGLSGIRRQNGTLHFGAMTRHAEIEASPLADVIPILHDCAAGIADPQVRNRGTLGGSLAEADPSGDWVPVLLTLETTVVAAGPGGERRIPLREFITDAYTTKLGPADLIREVVVETPPARSGGAYIAYKRCAPVYATATAAVQLTLHKDGSCAEARIALGCVGLTPVLPQEAEAALRGSQLDAKSIAAAAEAARAATDPQSDIRGSAQYKKDLVAALVGRAIHRAVQRARGERVEGGHLYA
jgi:carbon-monoxide dehydrogenase medium subunit